MALDSAERYYTQAADFFDQAARAFTYRKSNQYLISQLSQYAMKSGLPVEKVLKLVIQKGLNALENI